MMTTTTTTDAASDFPLEGRQEDCDVGRRRFKKITLTVLRGVSPGRRSLRAARARRDSRARTLTSLRASRTTDARGTISGYLECQVPAGPRETFAAEA